MLINIEADGPAVFIIAHYSSGTNSEMEWLAETIDSVKLQTDSNWKIIIVDDATTSRMALKFLDKLEKDFKNKIDIIRLKENKGPGNARNVGIQRAYQIGAPFIMYLDQDDISHPMRLEVTREIFRQQPAVGVIYSTFQIIDEVGNHVPDENITPSILEILEAHKTNPPQGKEVWIKIAIETGYINLTSATSVRTDIAIEYPFPNERVSEDYFTWLLYSASGAEYAYSSLIPAKYRIPKNIDGSRSRGLIGGQHMFNMIKSTIDTRGFQAAVKLAQARGVLTEEEIKNLKIKFYIRKAKSMVLDGEIEIAEDFYYRARDIDERLTDKYL